MTDGTGTTTWTYDGWGDLTSLVTPQGTTTYTLNQLGERTQMVDPVGTTSYGYNSKGFLASLLNPHGETTGYEYDSAGRVNKRILAHGAFEEITYDQRSRANAIRLKEPDTTLIRARTYTYDAASNMLTYAVTGQPMTTYGYDDHNQLTSESRTGYAASYTYDANGNRATKTLNAVTETYTNDAGDKLTQITGSVGTRTYTYDGLGRRKTRTANGQTATYSWDGESRLLGISGAGLNTSYGYNGFDARTSATDSLGTRTFRRDGTSVTSPLMADGQASYTPGVSERRSGTTRYLHSGLKNADSRSVSNNALEATRTYDAFGNLTASTGTWTGQQGYAGGFGYQEDPTGLMLLGHRYYDPEIGRFISRDFIEAGRNRYAYCDNNPLRRVDSNGLDWHNPGIVFVDPKFKGKVWVVGEAKKQKKQEFIRVPGGYNSGLDFDADIVIIQQPDGTQKRYFLMGMGHAYSFLSCFGGSGADGYEVPDHYEVDENGVLSGGMGMFFDLDDLPLGGLSKGRKGFLEDIAEAKKAPRRGKGPTRGRAPYKDFPWTDG